MIRTSVIIPVYNTVEYLDDCVRSVMAQGREKIEIIWGAKDPLSCAMMYVSLST